MEDARKIRVRLKPWSRNQEKWFSTKKSYLEILVVSEVLEIMFSLLIIVTALSFKSIILNIFEIISFG